MFGSADISLEMYHPLSVSSLPISYLPIVAVTMVGIRQWNKCKGVRYPNRILNHLV